MTWLVQGHTGRQIFSLNHNLRDSKSQNHIRMVQVLGSSGGFLVQPECPNHKIMFQLMSFPILTVIGEKTERLTFGLYYHSA